MDILYSHLNVYVYIFVCVEFKSCNLSEIRFFDLAILKIQ